MHSSSRSRHLRALRVLRGFLVPAIFLVAANFAQAQPLERLTFQQAIDRAVANNPTIAGAAEGILRAEAILQQTRSSSLPALAATFATNITNPVKFDTGSGTAVVVPGVQTTTSPLLSVLSSRLWRGRSATRPPIKSSWRRRM